ncbi:ABC transporter permease [Myxococcota bacterium]
MLGVWSEILDTIRKNKLRTGLTALSVAWGIFMLVLLLAAGNGLQNSVEHDFRDDAVNSIWLYQGRTGMPHGGHPTGRRIRFTNDDYQLIRDTIPGVGRITARFYLSGEYTVSYKNKRASFDVRACHPDHQFFEKTIVTAGRFLNDLDLKHRRKVAVIGKEVAEPLFGEQNPLGEWIDVNGTHYRVVGVFNDEGSDRELRKIYIPISTAQLAYGGQNRVHQIMVTVGDADAEGSRHIEDRIRYALAKNHNFSPEDKGAVRVRNHLEMYERVTSVFLWIRIFVWIVGIGTVIAGLVGVSNIMLIAVRERTREIGLRKAVGATPASIVALIVQEALFITGVSGYVGLVVGLGLVESVRRFLPETDYFRNPEVDLAVVMSATALLVVTGTLAGFFPALRAAQVNPVVALRDE